MSARDEALVNEGRKLHNAWFDGPDMEPHDRLIRMAKVAREIHQPRTITTHEELDALPDGAIVMDQFGGSHNIHRHNPRIKPEGYHYIIESGESATVIYTPEES